MTSFVTKKFKFLAVAAISILSSCSNGPNAGGGSAAVGSGSASDSGTYSSVFGQNASDRVFFALNSSQVDSAGENTLRAQAGYLKDHKDLKIVIEGHADERGTREYNLALSARRAQAAERYLKSQGVSNSMRTVAYGKEKPVAFGHDEAAWSQNRRAVTVPEGSETQQ